MTDQSIETFTPIKILSIDSIENDSEFDTDEPRIIMELSAEPTERWEKYLIHQWNNSSVSKGSQIEIIQSTLIIYAWLSDFQEAQAQAFTAIFNNTNDHERREFERDAAKKHSENEKNKRRLESVEADLNRLSKLMTIPVKTLEFE